MSIMTRITKKPAETMELGHQVGRLLKPNDVLALSGPLGSGKTCFSKGVALGLGLPSADAVVSPTFVLIQECEGRIPLFHIDAYRIEKEEEAEELGLEEYWFRGGVCLVEWAERIQGVLPEELLWIEFDIPSEPERLLSFQPQGERPVQIIQQLDFSGGGIKKQEMT